MNNKGFTLVELSIVLVIIGLLIGGILVAQSLIGSAQIQNQVRQLRDYEIAIILFHKKFRGIPGDSSFFGGNGNRIIENSTTSSQCYAGDWDNEMPKVFQDLSAIKFKEPFDGSTVLGEGYPALAMNKDIGMVAAAIGGFNAPNNGVVHLCLGIGDGLPNLGTASGAGSIPIADLLALDLKIDDGNGQAGNFSAYHEYGDCHTSGVYAVERDSGCYPSYYIDPFN